MSSKERGEKRNKNVLLGEKKEYHTTSFSSTLSLSLFLFCRRSTRGERGEKVSKESRRIKSECVCGGGVLLFEEEEEDDSRPRASVVEEDGSWSLDDDDDFDFDFASIDPSFLCSDDDDDDDDDDDVLRAGVFHRGVPPDGRGPLASRGGEVHLVPGMTIKLETKL